MLLLSLLFSTKAKPRALNIPWNLGEFEISGSYHASRDYSSHLQILPIPGPLHWPAICKQRCGARELGGIGGLLLELKLQVEPGHGY